MKKKKRIFMIAPATLLGLLFVALISQVHFDIAVEDLKGVYAQSPSKFIAVRGMQVHYRDEGFGPILILLHGVGDSLHVWQHWTEHLQSRFRIIRLDLPGQGLTGPQPHADYSINMQVDFINAFMDVMHVSRAHLAGHSMGGNIGWAFAASHPGRVQGLVLLDPGGYLPLDTKYPLVFKLARNPISAKFLRYWTPRAFIEQNLLQVYYNDVKVNDKLIDRYFQMSLRAGNRQAFIDRARRHTRVQPALVRDTLETIAAPTLIIWGRADAWLPVDRSAIFNRHIKNSRLKIYDACGHLPHAELPMRSARDTARFLETVL